MRNCIFFLIAVLIAMPAYSGDVKIEENTLEVVPTPSPIGGQRCEVSGLNRGNMHVVRVCEIGVAFKNEANPKKPIGIIAQTTTVFSPADKYWTNQRDPLLFAAWGGVHGSELVKFDLLPLDAVPSKGVPTATDDGNCRLAPYNFGAEYAGFEISQKLCVHKLGKNFFAFLFIGSKRPRSEPSFVGAILISDGRAQNISFSNIADVWPAQP